jgi:hypothetical protein
MFYERRIFRKILDQLSNYRLVKQASALYSKQLKWWVKNTLSWAIICTPCGNSLVGSRKVPLPGDMNIELAWGSGRLKRTFSPERRIKLIARKQSYYQIKHLVKMAYGGELRDHWHVLARRDIGSFWSLRGTAMNIKLGRSKCSLWRWSVSLKQDLSILKSMYVFEFEQVASLLTSTYN